jgi:trehalose 6-phosphate synthase
MHNLVIVSNRGPFGFSEQDLTDAEEALASGTLPNKPKFGEGGLVQAMAGLLRPGRWNPIWVGASMGDKDLDVANGYYSQLFRKMNEQKIAPEHFPHIEILPDKRIRFTYKEYDFNMRFVFFDTEHMHSYYNKFANGFLWPLMHLTREPLFYKTKLDFPKPSFEKSDFMQYMSSGVTFANTTFDETRRNRRLWQKGDDFVVWIQDYHLMQVADVYKTLLVEEGFSVEEKQKIRVGQFMHTPFFNIHEIQGLIREDKRNRLKAERFDPFPESVEQVLKRLTWGMLSNDFIGFHNKEYCDNYLSALQEWFPVEIRVAQQFYEINHSNGVTTVGAFPIGLDIDSILPEVRMEKRLNYQWQQRDLYDQMAEDRRNGRYVFGGLERRDYTKGLVERLKIFQGTLGILRDPGKTKNGARKDARLYQVTSPSRLANPAYQKLSDMLEREVQKTNITMSRGYQPVVHLDQGVPPPENYRFLRETDVMLVTPLEDGMNLVALEYILSQKYKKPQDRGLLVLGNSGAARIFKSRGFGEQDGIIFVNASRTKIAANKIAEAILKGIRLSERIIEYVEKECRVDDWAQNNMEAILHSRKVP